MKNKALKIVNLILALFLALFSIGYVFAWFADGVTTQLNLNGSAGSYFAYGNGSAEQPFGITTPQHLYNLAWLNNTGRFDKTKYYFTVGTRTQNEDGRYTYTPVTIDMGDTVLPPIGTTANPFLGDFNGCGSIISNLKVSTDLDKITNPVSYNNGDVLYSSAVGMFGETASGATSYIQQDGTPANFDTTSTSQDDITARASDVHDFILQDPQIEVFNNDEYYNTDSGTDRRVAGLAVGYADGNVNNISIYDSSTSGIPNVKLSVNNSGYTTLNSIIGGANRDATSGVDVTDIIGEDTTTGGENISIFLPNSATIATETTEEGEVITTYSAPQINYNTIITSVNGYTQEQITSGTRWTTDLDNANTTASNGDGGIGFGNFFLISEQILSDGNYGSQIRSSQSIRAFNLYEYTSTGTAEIVNSEGQHVSANAAENGWLNLIRTKNGGYNTDILTWSLRFNHIGRTLGNEDVTSPNLYLEDENILTKSNSTAITSGDTPIYTVSSESSTSNPYSNLALNTLWVNITETNGSLFIVGSSGGANIIVKKVLSAAEVQAALRFKAVKAQNNSNYSQYFSQENIFESNGNKNQTLINTLNNDSSLSDITNSYFFAKDDYDILKYVDCFNTGTFVAKLEFANNREDRGIYCNLSTSTNQFTYGNTTINADGNSEAGPGLYMIYADNNNADIHYLEATGVTNGDLGNEGDVGDPSELTKRVENVDFVYAANGAVVPVTSTNPVYERTNAIVTFEGGAAVILAFTRSVSENDHYILSVSFHNEDSDRAYTVTISQISGRSPAYFDSIPDGSIEFELGW